MESHRKILVIDDAAHVRQVISLKLKKRGYQVLTAVNGEEGLKKIKSEKPEVVISDIEMPKMDGKTLCEEVNDFKAEWPFLTIIMTCRISIDDQKWVEYMRDTVFMEKPFSPARLSEHIDQYFGME